MIYSKNKTINDKFSGNRILEIPFFQRTYAYKEPQGERLLADMKKHLDKMYHIF